VSVVDVRPADAYNKGHIAFAVNIPGDEFKSNVASPEKLAQALGPDGVSAAHEAVIVSGAGLTKEAALAYVMLEKLGQNKVSMLMDGADTWQKAGLLVTQAPTIVGPKKSPRDFAVPPMTYSSEPRKEVLIADPQSTNGIYPKVYLASGKEMLAKSPEGKVIHVPYTDLLNADGSPKAAKDIWAVLTKAGLSRYAEIICVSDDPGEAAANYYILKLMGFSDVKVLAS
jgi:thiosulfate/3-mercaptopyruvate sulfurtransferase